MSCGFEGAGLNGDLYYILAIYVLNLPNAKTLHIFPHVVVTPQA